MPQYARYIETDDLLFTGEGFPLQWQECLAERRAYAYIIPEPGEAQWPFVVCYFSRTPFTKAELRRLCQWDEAPLRRREKQGEARCGFRWPLDEVKLEAVSEQGEAILQQIEVVHDCQRVDTTLAAV
jgi:hypothetical protein